VEVEAQVLGILSGVLLQRGHKFPEQPSYFVILGMI
jgi:hypothetical protein